MEVKLPEKPLQEIIAACPIQPDDMTIALRGKGLPDLSSSDPRYVSEALAKGYFPGVRARLGYSQEERGLFVCDMGSGSLYSNSKEYASKILQGGRPDSIFILSEKRDPVLEALPEWLAHYNVEYFQLLFHHKGESTAIIEATTRETLVICGRGIEATFDCHKPTPKKLEREIKQFLKSL